MATDSRSIKTVDNASGREVEILSPEIFCCETLEELMEFLEEAQILRAVNAQLLVQWRSAVRTRLAATNDDDSFKYTLDEVKNSDKLKNWVPQMKAPPRSDAEKIASMVANMGAEDVKRAIEEMQAAMQLKAEEERADVEGAAGIEEDIDSEEVPE
jgi:hypothetical protein